MIEFPLGDAGLSAQGLARREAMRGTLMREVDRRRTRRHAVRIGSAAAAACAVAALGAWAVLLASHAPTPERPTVPLVADTGATAPQAPTPALPRIHFELVAGNAPPDDPRIVRASAPSAEMIGDDELLLLLEAAGHPAAGLIRTADTARVTVAIPPLPASADPG